MAHSSDVSGKFVLGSEADFCQLLERHLGDESAVRTLRRAEAVLIGSALSSTAVDTQNGKCTASARGQLGETYAVEIYLDGSLSAECTCPADKTRSPCKHAVAVALHFLRLHAAAPDSLGGSDQRAPGGNLDAVTASAAQEAGAVEASQSPADATASSRAPSPVLSPVPLTAPRVSQGIRSPSGGTQRTARKLPPSLSQPLPQPSRRGAISRAPACPSRASRPASGAALRAVAQVAAPPRRASRASRTKTSAAELKRRSLANLKARPDTRTGLSTVRLCGDAMRATSDDVLLHEAELVLQAAAGVTATVSSQSPQPSVQRDGHQPQQHRAPAADVLSRPPSETQRQSGSVPEQPLLSAEQPSPTVHTCEAQTTEPALLSVNSILDADTQPVEVYEQLRKASSRSVPFRMAAPQHQHSAPEMQPHPSRSAAAVVASLQSRSEPAQAAATRPVDATSGVSEARLKIQPQPSAAAEVDMNAGMSPLVGETSPSQGPRKKPHSMLDLLTRQKSQVQDPTLHSAEGNQAAGVPEMAVTPPLAAFGVAVAPAKPSLLEIMLQKRH
mmetsp:Transcript_17036/g.50854  ORF Transcript_17036/g.50854 Transcript_17036/m.50854 type:complete len:559 (-) Transcript_17036:298-1974(-)|eukprot:CAMPEP_0206137314 /NCGR_PEP_ID=MMETSP1473-20131121/2461_1 /ASSEMBLY_ACC=CAM_ASM_001109 /TAXON_ID=1461547 /ORGANISM="Stichococcus sp, Strain RCC1054" /LENGTH=558 /DNA_ID=CAMNT_0053530339 /DNA_START=191 /DNA_END=1867 /DNA_ORIENTATION=-